MRFIDSRKVGLCWTGQVCAGRLYAAASVDGVYLAKGTG